MQLYVLDRSKNVLATTSSQYNDKHHKELTAGASSFEFDINKNDEAAQYMVSGNYITTLDDQGRPWSFTILYYDEYQLYKTIYCEDVGIELYNKACDVWYYPDAHPFEYYFDLVTDGTPWELGINQLSDLSRALKYTGRDTGLGRMLSILKAFDDAECIFNIQMNGPVPVKYVIDVYKKIGTVQDNIQIAYNEELNDIKKTETRQSFVTAIQGVGSVIQDTSEDAAAETDTDKPQEYVDFADLEYDDGDFFTTKGDKFLRARTANQQFNPGDQGFIEDFYEYDTSDSSELFNRTLTQIQTRSQPQFTYEADVKVIDPNLDIGDTVTIIDHDYNPALYLQARAATLDKSYTDATQGAITFTNYVVLTDTVTQQIAALRSKVNGIKNGSTSYVWIRYADDDQGTGISQSPKDKAYVAILAKVNQPVPSDDPKDYVGHWVRIAGEDGLDGQIGPQGPAGTDGIPGKDGVSSYTHIAYANSADGATDFSVSESNRTYIGMYVDFTATDSTDHTKYAWTLVKGADGAQGIPGKAGADGKIPYFHIAYADNANGTDGFSTTDSLNKLYIGQYTDFVQADSIDPNSYAWTLIKGDKGDKGDTGADGVAGKDGVGIKSTEITYTLSDSSTTTPTTGWTTSVPSLVKGKYLWTKTVWLYTDNTSESGYSTTYIGKDGNDGNNGVAGKDGVGISATKVEYVGSTSGTNKPTSGWSTTVPNVAAGSFLWTKTTWSYTDGTSESGYSVAKMGEKGDTGVQGLQGPKGDQGVKGPAGADGKTSYTHIAYANSATGEGFSEQPDGKAYIGMYVDFNVTDSTDVTKYNWSLIKGEDGSDGIPGKAGADGKTPYLHIAYADSADGKDGFYVGGGGRNLLKNTGNLSATSTTSSWNTLFSSSQIYDSRIKSISGVSAMTFSFDVHIPLNANVGDAVGIQLKGQNSQATNTGSNEWNTLIGEYKYATKQDDLGKTIRASLSIQKDYNYQSFDTALADTARIFIRQSLNIPGFVYSKIKLEEGNISTPWSPAPSEAHPTYMGTYTDYTQADSLDPTAYLWSQIKGEAGANGKDGQDAYLHIAYANSVDGKTDFTTDQAQAHNRDYLGTYSDNTKAQSTDPTKYTWQLTRGAQGLQGQPGSKDVPVVTLSSTAPPSPKNGDFWYQTTTDSSGQKITGFSVYSGGKWVPSKIDQSTLVLTKLVSVEIDSATINSPDITVPFDYFDESQNEYKGSMEFKDGMLKHISTMTGGGMLKTVISPTGYTLDAYANQSEYTKNNPYIHTEVYADNISLSNANTKKSGILDSSGIGGTLNNGTDSSIGINMSWADVHKYLANMGHNGSKRDYDWFDMMASSQSHPNLIKNSSFTSYYDSWDHANADQKSWFTWTSLVDGNVETVDHSTGGAGHYLGQKIPHLIPNVQICYSFRYRFEGTLSTGSGVMFTVYDGSGKSLQSWTTKVDPAGANTSDWYYLAINPITLPANTASGYWTFTHNDNMTIHFAQPMLNYGSYAAPYQPT